MGGFIPPPDIRRRKSKALPCIRLVGIFLVIFLKKQNGPICSSNKSKANRRVSPHSVRRITADHSIVNFRRKRLSNYFSYLTLQALYQPNPTFDDLKIPFCVPLPPI